MPEKKLRERVSELKFGLEMLRWVHGGGYPLEPISMVKGEDERGIFYFPVINKYCSSEQYVTGPKKGYKNRERALRCVGRCWDKAEKHIKKP